MCLCVRIGASRVHARRWIEKSERSIRNCELKQKERADHLILYLLTVDFDMDFCSSKGKAKKSAKWPTWLLFSSLFCLTIMMIESSSMCFAVALVFLPLRSCYDYDKANYDWLKARAMRAKSRALIFWSHTANNRISISMLAARKLSVSSKARRTAESASKARGAHFHSSERYGVGIP